MFAIRCGRRCSRANHKTINKDNSKKQAQAEEAEKVIIFVDMAK